MAIGLAQFGCSGRAEFRIEPRWQFRDFPAGFPQQVAYDVEVSVSGDLAIAGFAAKSGTRQPWVARFSPGGKLQWIRVFRSGDASHSAEIHGISWTASEELVAVGFKKEKNRGSDVWVIRLSRSGETLWERGIDGGGGGDDIGNDVALLGDGTIVAVGSAGGDRGGEVGDTGDVFAAAWTEDGQRRWTWRKSDVPAGGWDEVNRVVVGQDHRIYATGLVSDGRGTRRPWVGCLDSTGAPVWQATYGAKVPVPSEGWDLDAQSDGSLWVLARSVGSGEFRRPFLWKGSLDGRFSERIVALGPRAVADLEAWSFARWGKNFFLLGADRPDGSLRVPEILSVAPGSRRIGSGSAAWPRGRVFRLATDPGRRALYAAGWTGDTVETAEAIVRSWEILGGGR